MDREPEATPAPPLGATIGGRYQLLRYLGAGGMGAVYEAEDPDGRRVALKAMLEIPPTAHGQELVARFRREAKLMGSLASPYIVAALEAGWDQSLEIPYLVMPLLSGLDLGALLDRTGALHPTVAVRLVYQGCRALEVAHRAGVIHRDIKPDNLFLDHDPQGKITVRVLDFGIAKCLAEDEKLTRTGSVMGTPHYMSPEQTTSAKHVDARTDIWGMGCTLYHALAGVAPFDHLDTFAQIVVAIHAEDVPALQSHAPWVDPGLATVVHGALLRDLEARCPSIGELMDALRPFAFGSEEVTAAMLHPVPAELRQVAARPARLPARWQRVTPSVPPPPLEDASADPLLGRTLGGCYALVRRLGQGGMGTVYEAHGSDGGRYAVKVIDPELAGRSPAARRRFVREAKAAMSIGSEHVVRVVAADTDLEQELPFIVMELLQGIDLAALIQRRGALELEPVVRLFMQACRGLAAAHALGLVHRDIKPANLFLHELPSGELVVKICDFGIAKRMAGSDTAETSTELTRTGGVLGSPMYMSPEQATNAKNVDARTDIWSLGISLYQALCGEPPWEGKTTVGELIVAICTGELPHLQDKASWIPQGLAAVAHQALSRKPEARLADMSAFARALAPFSGGSETLSADMLVPVSAKNRARVAGRAAPPDSSSMEATAPLSHTVGAARAGPRYRRLRLAAAAGLAVAAASAGAILLWRLSSEPSAPLAKASTEAESAKAQAAATAPPASAAASASVEVAVQVLPRQAQVTVDGRARELVDGELRLSGRRGQAFAVVASHQGREETKTVTITKEGTASLELIVVPAAPAPRPGQGAAQPIAARPPGPKPTEPPPAKPAPPPAPPPAKDAPPARKTKAADGWR
ncbi:MAG: serine/threonine protein kinase [Deltaproteobacteria bacterium]|nr:serine/threonine protein kinase [Deltaproteobacteria bacterium]